MLLPPFADTSFDPRPTLAGVPVDAIALAAAMVATVIGLLAIRRITTLEGEPRTFRATARREPTTLVLLAGAVGFAAIAIVLLVTRAA